LGTLVVTGTRMRPAINARVFTFAPSEPYLTSDTMNVSGVPRPRSVAFNDGAIVLSNGADYFKLRLVRSQ
jgi:hypothetical protein